MNHLTRICALVLLLALTVLCAISPPSSWEQKSTTVQGEGVFSSSAAVRLQAEIAPLTFWRPIRGMGPTTLAPSVINEFPVEEDLRQGQCSVEDYRGQIISDSLIMTYLRTQLAEFIAQAPDYVKAFPPQVFLYRDPIHHNAFAGGGGYIFISVDRIAHAPCEESLLHDICHELGHNALRHGTARQTFRRVLFAQESALEAQLNQVEVKTNPEKFKLLVFALKRSQRNQMDEIRLNLHQQELEADVFAIQLLHKAGYDTGKVTEEYWRKAPHFSGGDGYFDSHPHDTTRALRMDLERNELVFTPARKRQDNQTQFAAVQKRARAIVEGRDFEPPLFIDPPAVLR